MVTIIPVLFVDDNRELSNIFQFYLEETGLFTVHVCLDGEDALRYIAENPVEAVISDFDMPDMDGITLLRHIRSTHPRLPFIMLTGNDSKETAIEALNAGADFYQNKAEDLEIQVLDLSHKLKILVEKAQAELAIQKKDKILEVISKTAGQLLKGCDFYSEMEKTLREVAPLTGAKGAFIGNPVLQENELHGVPPEVIVWWDDEKEKENGSSGNLLLTLLSELVRAISSGKEKSGQLIHCRSDDAGPAVRRSMENLSVTSAIFFPVFVGTEQWGYLSFLFDGIIQIPAEPERYALTMMAELAGAARYRTYMEEYFKNPVEKSLVGVFLIRSKRFIYINPRFSMIFGIPREEIIRTKSLPGLLDENDSSRVLKVMQEICAGSIESGHLEVTAKSRDGSRIFLELYLTVFRHNSSSFIIGNCLDITQRKEAEEQVRVSEELLKQNMMSSLEEKETLLREIHHRVKNNMQIIASLLRLSSFESKNPEVHDIIRDCRNRIFSMAAIHEKLYQTDKLTAVPLGSYIRDIGSRIIHEFEMDTGQITYDVIEGEPVLVDISIGIPVGLMINELITNSIKHAFPQNHSGTIEIEISLANASCHLRYRDNGIGLPADFSPNMQDSLGIELIRNLTHQIQGTVSFESENGMICNLIFPLTP